MTTRLRQTLADLDHQRTPTRPVGLDGLAQVSVPLVPEIRLHLAKDAIVLWARMEAEAGNRLVAPFWASA